MEDSEKEKAKPKTTVLRGLEHLYLACKKIYPDQPNPLQVSAVVKYWYESIHLCVLCNLF